MTEPATSVEQLLFSAPLYQRYSLKGDSLIILKILADRGSSPYRFDAHCPYCERSTTWGLYSHIAMSDLAWENVANFSKYDTVGVQCARDENHRVRFYFLLSNLIIEKVGQYPSLATISNDEIAKYRPLMSRLDGAEFHKAIGLAAHGVGVGSFVYLRRVFERLVHGRFDEFREAEGWKEEDFSGLRMNDKISFLKDHLPPFLVEHSRIYGILSKGIHELDEDQCLAFFETLKQSILIILEEDKKKKEEAEMRSKFSAAISGINL